MQQDSFIPKGFSSAALHGHQSSHPNSAHVTPIYASSTFVFESAQQGIDRFAGNEEGYIYSRWGNPTFADAEKVLEALEGFGISNEDGNPLPIKAILHASGQAAMTTMFLSNLAAGDKLISHYSLYGGSHELMQRVLKQCGIETIFLPLNDEDELASALKKDPSIKMVHIETPANPTLQCIDIAMVTEVAHRHNCKVSVDNTFATPYLQRPFGYGVDYVFHSTTKFLNGHGTAIGGVLLGKDLEQMNTTVTKWHRLLGGNSNPFDAFLLIQGMKTLAVRMEKHCANAMEVANFLANHSAVDKVNYTGLPSHPSYHIAQKQMALPGAMLSFELKEGFEGGKRFIDRLQMCTRAVSLGTVDTLISHPASMTHFGVSKEERLQSGISDGLIRMSVGIETLQDILADLDQSLKG